MNVSLFVWQGMVTSQRGPTILALSHLVNTDIQHAASFFSLGAGGQLAGCIATGVAFGRFRAPMLLFWALLGLGVTTASFPWCRGFGIMAAIYFVTFFFVGCVETGQILSVIFLRPPPPPPLPRTCESIGNNNARLCGSLSNEHLINKSGI
jgi:hypothetical protein